jgi:cytochrome b pre-mRNA-processing protein 3
MPLNSIFPGPARDIRDSAAMLYALAVEQARRPEFYSRLGVPDTLDGRFEMIALHVFLLLHRLKQRGEAPALAQALFDLMFQDMDQNLREIGVGDLSVGKRVKTMAKALYGRCAAYEAGLAEGDAGLAAALRRNLFGTLDAVEDVVLARFCAYLRREAAALAAQPLGQLTERPAFGAVP